MKDIKGREIKLGDIVCISNTSKRIYAGHFFVKDGPMNPLWDKSYLSLHRIDEHNGEIGYAARGHFEQSYPIQEDPELNKEAIIEICDNVSKHEVADFLMDASRQLSDKALSEAREYGLNSPQYAAATEAASIYETAAKEARRAVDNYFYWEETGEEYI